MSSTETILDHLIAFPTVSRDSNLGLIRYVEGYLGDQGVDSTLTYNDEKSKANLYAVFGADSSVSKTANKTERNSGGVMLSGHTDVVPTDGQHWTVDPFKMSAKNNRLYGRGTTDMKGFIASVLAMVPRALERKLNTPIHLAFSYDEEIGCVGVRRMIDMLESAPNTPDFCIVGEPTLLEVAIAHKGKTGAICRCRGVEAHSALATQGLNAIYLATEMISDIREIQDAVIKDSRHDNQFGVPYTTLHVGTIHGGTALNIIPNHCEFKFEIRNLKSDDPLEIMDRIKQRADGIANKYQKNFPEANVDIEIFNEYPALDIAPEEKIVQYVQSLVGNNKPIKIDFGTEGGLFQNQLHVPTVVCGPGSMDQGHKPDEYIDQSELERCDKFLGRLLDDISD